MQEFNVGDIVRITEKFSRFNGKTGIVKEVIGEGLNVLVDDYLIGIMKKYAVKIDDKPQAEPFKLKKGMRVKNKFGNTHIFLELTNGEYWYENRTCNFENEIDWEATRKLNPQGLAEPVSEMELYIKELKEILNVQSNQPNVNTDDYMRG